MRSSVRPQNHGAVQRWRQRSSVGFEELATEHFVRSCLTQKQSNRAFQELSDDLNPRKSQLQMDAVSEVFVSYEWRNTSIASEAVELKNENQKEKEGPESRLSAARETPGSVNRTLPSA